MSALTDHLHSQGFRITNQRMAVLSVINETGGHLTATEIFQRVSERLPKVTEPTIYRTLEFLTRQGLALIAHIGNGHFVYESAERHHLHVACERCGKVVEVNTDLLKPLSESLEELTGYQINTSHFTFLGICPVCAQRH